MIHSKMQYMTATPEYAAPDLEVWKETGLLYEDYQNLHDAGWTFEDYAAVDDASMPLRAPTRVMAAVAWGRADVHNWQTIMQFAGIGLNRPYMVSEWATRLGIDKKDLFGQEQHIEVFSRYIKAANDPAAGVSAKSLKEAIGIQNGNCWTASDFKRVLQEARVIEKGASASKAADLYRHAGSEVEQAQMRKFWGEDLVKRCNGVPQYELETQDPFAVQGKCIFTVLALNETNFERVEGGRVLYKNYSPPRLIEPGDEPFRFGMGTPPAVSGPTAILLGEEPLAYKDSSSGKDIVPMHFRVIKYVDLNANFYLEQSEKAGEQNGLKFEKSLLADQKAQEKTPDVRGFSHIPDLPFSHGRSE
ncbi:cell division protein [Lasius niger]|uniref:Cell division protein n=1 Tax=Lasius niger TaxID=67767 RepID=A0A0J7JYF0_LASNI|nr:cell division protein [Lasius niger]